MAIVLTLPAGAPRFPKVSIVSESGATVVLPFAPNDVGHKNLSPEFVQQKRPGAAPLLTRSGDQLQEMSFTAQVVSRDRSSVEAVIARLMWIVASGERVRVGYDLLSGGLWRVTADVFGIVDHDQANGICSANVELTFTRASDAVLKLGPASGGAKPATKAKAVTARAGESGSALALRTGSTSPGAVADANGIRDFRRVAAGASLRPAS